jgi:uncharacterized caspase-like protein
MGPMVSRRVVLAAGAATLLWPGLAHAQTPRRGVGLVIGNNKYSGQLTELNNCLKDAQGVAAALNACNIDVPDSAIVKNANKKKMRSAIASFAARLKSSAPDEIGFFYFSGHGASRTGGAGSNYLIAAGKYAKLDQQLWDRSLALEEIIDALKDVERPYVLAFDACRTVLNLPAIQAAGSEPDLTSSSAGESESDAQGQMAMLPAQTSAYLAEQSKWRGGSATFSRVRGLGRAVAARSNHFLAFSSWEGQFALDGDKDDDLGPYATALTRAMKAGKRTIPDMFNDVRDSVLDQTVQQQEPMGLMRMSSLARDVVIAPQGLRQPDAKTTKLLRQALVVSCSYANHADQTNIEDLQSTTADGDLIAVALAENGFDVRRERDPTKKVFNDQLIELIGSLKAAGSSAVGVVYFAGVGSSHNKRNYLLPIPAAGEWLPDDPEDLAPQAISIQGLISTLELADAAGIVVLIDGGRRTRSSSGKVVEGGFAREFGTRKVLLVHATRPGQKAQVRLHNGSKGSPFAQALSEELLDTDQPRRDITVVMSSVMNKVSQWTGGSMTPYGLSSMDASSSLGGSPPAPRAPIYFRSQTGLDVDS